MTADQGFYDVEPEPRDHETDAVLLSADVERREDLARDRAAGGVMSRGETAYARHRVRATDALMTLRLAELRGVKVDSPEWLRLMGTVRDRADRALGIGGAWGQTS